MAFDLNKLKPIKAMPKAAKKEKTLDDVKEVIQARINDNRTWFRRGRKVPKGKRAWFKDLGNGTFGIRIAQGIQPIYIRGRKTSSNWYGPLSVGEVDPAFAALSKTIGAGGLDKQIQDAWKRSKRKKRKKKAKPSTLRIWKAKK